jgi:2-iminobutanoate/2-iminopropanoate deaminase
MKQLTLLFGILLVIVLACSHHPITKEVISAPDAPKAIGPYSQAIRAGNTLYLAGQLGMVPETGLFAEGGIEAQARQALENQKAVLKAAGFTFEDVVQCQVFVTDMNNYPVFNGIYAEYFEKDFPARAVVEVSRLPKDGLVEIMMVAVKTD